ncbi:arginine deiminase family protein [Rhodohalobacter sp.]|uniref:arginine deiminase n=1 Tax=Rhodohalobacter sp. TaxID=1974210 RepID=UPI002ACEF5B6|nr:arginine deiminase family protein [Rhodohalobacter sp.]MDZ7754879.1 arginine deiminase family protein [Rhodohalobacter sp.]
MNVGIPSEINPLKKVIVHTPGHEVSLVNPENKDELLFDDIIFESDAKEEHLDMLKIFKAAMPEDGEVIEILDLALECFQDESVREEFIELMIKELPFENIHTVQSDLKELPAEKLLQFVVEGSIPPNRAFNLNPAPNLLFTRDLSAVVGNHIILSRAAKKARAREFLLMNMIVKHHPLFSEIKNKTINITGQQSIEGGDVLVASEKIVLIGMSERTSFSGLMSVAEKLIKSGVEHVLAVDIPKQRSSMHLDTIFTFADKNECIVFPPAIEGQTENVVDLYASGDHVQTRRCKSLKDALEELTGRNFNFIRCGGEEQINQYREQWTDGANVFALAPGVIVGYGRNTKTFEMMAENGYKLMDQYDFIDEFTNKPFDYKKEGKIAISFQGHELCRGRGGARCMTMPVLRSQL